MTQRAWDLTVRRPVRVLARRAAKKEGCRINAYVEALICADGEKRGWQVPAPRPLSMEAQVRAFVCAATKPVRAAAIMAAFELPRSKVDAMLSRAVAKGYLENDGTGAYSAAE